MASVAIIITDGENMGLLRTESFIIFIVAGMSMLRAIGVCILGIASMLSSIVL